VKRKPRPAKQILKKRNVQKTLINRRKLTLKDYLKKEDVRLHENRKQRRRNVTLRLYYWWLSVSNMVVVMVKQRCLSKHLAKGMNGSYIKSTWLCIRTRFFCSLFNIEVPLSPR